MKRTPFLMVAYVHTPWVLHSWHASMMDLVNDATRGFDVGVSPLESGPNLSRPRSMLVEMFLENRDVGPGFTHMLWVDTDVTFKVADIQTLLAADKDIVGAYYLGRHPSKFTPFVTAVFQGEDGAFRQVEEAELPEAGCIEVAGLGMGLTLVRREVVEALGANHSELWPFGEMSDRGRASGEDVTFCLRAKEKGFSSWLCVDAKVGHSKMFTFWP